MIKVDINNDRLYPEKWKWPFTFVVFFPQTHNPSLIMNKNIRQIQ